MSSYPLFLFQIYILTFIQFKVVQHLVKVNSKLLHAGSSHRSCNNTSASSSPRKDTSDKVTEIRIEAVAGKVTINDSPNSLNEDDQYPVKNATSPVDQP